MGRPPGSKNKPKRNTRPQAIKKSPFVEEPKEQYKCTKCGKVYAIQKGHFAHSNSIIYVENNRYIHICTKCLNDLYIHYVDVLDGNEFEAIRRVCMKFDIYYNERLAKASPNISADRPRMGSYVAKCNLNPHTGKTYDDTIDEERNIGFESFEDAKDNAVRAKQKSIKFFGLGFTDDEYVLLQAEYDDWIAKNEATSKSHEQLFRNLAISQLNVNRAVQSGDPKKLESAMATFQSLLGSANLKPSQTNQNTLADQNSFGTLIKKWENEEPIPEPDEKFKDVDGIKKYISIWLYGHLCKMIGVKNFYSEQYEQEVAKYEASKTEYLDDEVDDEISKVVGDSIGN